MCRDRKKTVKQKSSTGQIRAKHNDIRVRHASHHRNQSVLSSKRSGQQVNKIQTRDEVVKRKEKHKKTGHLAQSRDFWQLGGVLNRWMRRNRLTHDKTRFSLTGRAAEVYGSHSYDWQKPRILTGFQRSWDSPWQGRRSLVRDSRSQFH